VPTTSIIDRIDAQPATAARGAAVVLGGRGETSAVYRRLADRLAFDGYAVVAVGTHELKDGSPAAGTDVVEAVRAALPDTGAGPRILIGSDAGVTAAWRAIADGTLHVDGVVSAGALTATGTRAIDRAAEITERTACPVHRGRLATDGVLEVGTLGARAAHDFVDEELAARIPVPALVFHGEADTISGFDEASAVYAALPDARVFGVEQGLHDVLNDLTHRSVAAQIIQFAERLRTPEIGLRRTR
jgi:alpha-beta hydrolase superfamily lysophospholipase